MSRVTSEQRARFAAALSGVRPDAASGAPLALAVSGGPDSLALLLLAAAVRPGAVIAATVDHGLRAAAAAEARQVAARCAALGVPHATLAVRVADDPAGVQAAARAARYAALEGWARTNGAALLATAHHADDQAETVVMRLARGAGLAGLSGIRPVRPLSPAVTLVRPLLRWRRAELAGIVAAAGWTAADDPANRDPRFDRTRARALLAGGWPEAGRVAAAAAHLAEAEAALDWAAARLAEERLHAEDEGWTLDPAGLPPELRRRLVLGAFERLGAGAPAGPDLARLLARLDRGEHATLGPVKASPGPPWRFVAAPLHRGRDRSA